jgi:hypothetical protein
LTYGYGYRPWRLVISIVGVAAVSAVIYWWAAELGVMAPTDRGILYDPRFESCHQEYPFNWTKCRNLQRSYTVFNPIIYSIDLIVPILALQQSRDWAPQMTQSCGRIRFEVLCWQSLGAPGPIAYSPLGVIAVLVSRVENLFGWFAGLMIVAVASGWVKRD